MRRIVMWCGRRQPSVAPKRHDAGAGRLAAGAVEAVPDWSWAPSTNVMPPKYVAPPPSNVTPPRVSARTVTAGSAKRTGADPQ